MELAEAIKTVEMMGVVKKDVPEAAAKAAIEDFTEAGATAVLE